MYGFDGEELRGLGMGSCFSNYDTGRLQGSITSWEAATAASCLDRLQLWPKVKIIRIPCGLNTYVTA